VNLPAHETSILTVRPKARRIVRRGVVALIIVVGTLLVVAALTPTVICRLGDQRRVYTTATLEHLGSIILEFRRTEGRYPAPGDWMNDLVRHGYLDRSRSDPWWHDYVYVPGPREFSLRSFGADGREGGSDAAADIVQVFPAGE
jgi:general secretion pathway protein G